MPSPITAEDFLIQSLSGDACEAFRKMMETSDKLHTFFEWFMNADGTELSADFKLMMQDVAVPVGAIVWFPRDSVPEGYLVANGQEVNRTTYANLFAVYGTTFGSTSATTFALPDMQGRFPMGASGAYPVGGAGGEANVTLTVEQLAAHSHGPGSPDDDSTGFIEKTSAAGKALDIVADGDAIVSPTTAEAGGGQPHNNLPPYRVGYWLVKH